MVSVKSKMYVSTKNYEYDSVLIEKVLTKYNDYFALTLNSKSNIYSFVPIEKIEIVDYKGLIYNIIFENCFGIQYNLQTKPECEFITKRGLVTATKLNNLDVFIDQNNLLCKMISKTSVEESIKLANVSIQYTYNYFCNGILIKGKI